MLTFIHKDYGRVTSISRITEKFIHSYPPSVIEDDYYGSPENLPPLSGVGVNVTNGSRANATFVILARNSDLDGTIRAVRSIEDRFNRDYRYPYVFLNDEPFSDDFKRFVQSPLPLFSVFNGNGLAVGFRFSAQLRWSLGRCRQNIGVSRIG